MSKLDLVDRRILAELLRDAAQPVAQIAERVGLSQTPCWKRIQRLERDGVVAGRIAVVDPARLGLGLTAFMSVAAPDHSPAWRATFAEAVAGLTEVVEVFRVAGEFDYLLRVVVADMTAFDALYQRLTAAVAIKSVTSHFAMERLKAAPIDPIGSLND
jgi:Lrp/AsnC family transcriptional regulator